MKKSTSSAQTKKSPFLILLSLIFFVLVTCFSLSSPSSFAARNKKNDTDIGNCHQELAQQRAQSGFEQGNFFQKIWGVLKEKMAKVDIEKVSLLGTIDVSESPLKACIRSKYGLDLAQNQWDVHPSLYYEAKLQGISVKGQLKDFNYPQVYGTFTYDLCPFLKINSYLGKNLKGNVSLLFQVPIWGQFLTFGLGPEISFKYNVQDEGRKLDTDDHKKQMKKRKKNRKKRHKFR